MKKRILIFALAAVFAGVLFGSGMYVGAATKNGAGSQNDPVVTLSYLEYRLGKQGANNTSSDAGTGSGGFEKVTLSKGERCMPGEGGVIVLYSGACTAVGKGLIDTTNAKIIYESSSVPAYSQLLAPDGTCGVVASADTVLFISKGE